MTREFLAAAAGIVLSLALAYIPGVAPWFQGLDSQNGFADDQYYLAAMTLKSIQDKSNGAMIAGPGTPWGENNGDGNQGGYHLVWARDLFKFASALISAGDTASANLAVDYFSACRCRPLPVTIPIRVPDGFRRTVL